MRCTRIIWISMIVGCFVTVSATDAWDNDLQQELMWRELQYNTSMDTSFQNGFMSDLTRRGMDSSYSLNDMTQQLRQRDMEMQNSLNDIRQQMRQRDMEMRNLKMQNSLNDMTQQLQQRNIEMQNSLNDFAQQSSFPKIQATTSLSDFTQQMDLHRIESSWMRDFSYANSFNNLQLAEVPRFNTTVAFKQNFTTPTLDASFGHDSIRQRLRNRDLSMSMNMPEINNSYSNIANSFPGTLTRYTSVPTTIITPDGTPPLKIEIPFGTQIGYIQKTGDNINEYYKTFEPLKYSKNWESISKGYSSSVDAIDTAVTLYNTLNSNDPYWLAKSSAKVIGYFSKPAGYLADKLADAGYELRQAEINLRNMRDINRHLGPGSNQTTLHYSSLTHPSRFESQHNMFATINSQYNDGFTSLSRTAKLQITRTENYPLAVHLDPTSTTTTTRYSSRTYEQHGVQSSFNNQTNQLQTYNMNQLPTYNMDQFQTNWSQINGFPANQYQYNQLNTFDNNQYNQWNTFDYQNNQLNTFDYQYNQWNTFDYHNNQLSTFDYQYNQLNTFDYNQHYQFDYNQHNQFNTYDYNQHNQFNTYDYNKYNQFDTYDYNINNPLNDPINRRY